MVWGEGDEQQFAMFELTPSFSRRGAVEVKWFQAYPLRQGVGTRAMQELQAMAREDGISLTLFPWDKGQVSQAKLTKFYKGQGFKPNVKGGKDMYWEPISERKQYPLEDFEGLKFRIVVDADSGQLFVNALDAIGNNELGHVTFDLGDGKDLDPQDLFVKDKFRGQGIARIMYDFVKSKGYKIQRSWDQTDAGAGFWNKHKGEDVRVWEQQNVDEAESGTPNAREIARKLRDAGYKQLGSGVDATVWAKDTSHVIKILMPDDTNSQAEQVFQKFYEFSQSHQDIDCVPKFHMVNKIDIGDSEYTQIEMEHLYPIHKNSLEEALVWILSDYAVSGEPWRQVVTELTDPTTWETYSGKLGPKLAELVTTNFKNPKILSMYSILYAVMKLLYQSGHINRFGWDLHTENVMQRNNGQLVIIDPWFHINEKSR
jgi:hypothetical protein